MRMGFKSEGTCPSTRTLVQLDTRRLRGGRGGCCGGRCCDGIVVMAIIVVVVRKHDKIIIIIQGLGDARTHAPFNQTGHSPRF